MLYIIRLPLSQCESEKNSVCFNSNVCQSRDSLYLEPFITIKPLVRKNSQQNNLQICEDNILREWATFMYVNVNVMQ